MEPKLMLVDEPTSALAPETVGEVLDGLRARGRRQRGVMEEGRVIESGPPEEVLENPAHPRTREFLARGL